MFREIPETAMTVTTRPESDNESYSWARGSRALASSAWPMRTFRVLLGLMESVVVVCGFDTDSERLKLYK